MPGYRKPKITGRYNLGKALLDLRKGKIPEERTIKPRKDSLERRKMLAENRELVRQELKIVIPELSKNTISSFRTRLEKDAKDILSLPKEKRESVLESIIEKTINQAEKN